MQPRRYETNLCTTQNATGDSENEKKQNNLKYKFDPFIKRQNPRETIASFKFTLFLFQ